MRRYDASQQDARCHTVAVSRASDREHSRLFRDKRRLAQSSYSPGIVLAWSVRVSIQRSIVGRIGETRMCAHLIANQRTTHNEKE